MVDLGRSTFSLDMLKRIVRILVRLKMNQLHLHLYDDELCGLRFEGLPFGSDNPGALTISELSELVAYATERHVEIVPELEGWGHVGSLVYHRPELRGGEGMYAGSSFRIGEGSFALMRSLIEQIVPLLPEPCTVHLGLDEAKWFPDPRLPEGFDPERMVGTYYEILQQCAAAKRKHATLRLWADHAGRPIPPELADDIIIEPWQYWNGQRPAIDRAIGRYSGVGKPRFMMGAGQSVAQFRGAYHATCYWCRQAAASPNVDGVNVTMWGRNDLERNLISVFVGAGFAWNPFPPSPYDSYDDYESFERIIFPLMQRWQTWFRDAYPDELRRDQGPSVIMGRYLWGDRHGQPVSPCVVTAGTGAGHDYLNEA